MMRNRIISSTFLLALLGVVIAAAHATDAARIEALMDHARRLAGQKQFAQAANTYRRVLSIDPDHAVAYRNIWKIDRALGVPDNPALRQQLARDFGEGFFLSASEHYLILYDGRHSWADSRARTLEMAYDQFHDQMRKAGFKPVPLQHRMVCLMFNTHDDYLAYAREVDRIEHNWSSGYYSQRTNRVSFFNIHYSPQLKDTVLEIQKLENEVQRLVGEAAQDKRQQGRLNSTRARLSAHRRAYERAAAYGNIQQTIHEAAHQIAFNSGIQTRASAYPMWFSEGLATGFETIAPAAPFGPAYDNSARRKTLVQAIKSKKVLPLSEFIGLRAPPNADGDRENAYAQAWGLFHYLYNERPADLVAFAERFKAQPITDDFENRFRRVFIETFGPIEQVEQAYRKHVLAM